jgi:acyl-CoA reductase-like NAD-dependent aldehyde dehydrogenase
MRLNRHRRQKRGDAGYFVEPTVFAGVCHEMRVSHEEIFGPVASVIPFKDDEDGIRIAKVPGRPHPRFSNVRSMRRWRSWKQPRRRWQ